jgi:hypothetical protein
LWLRLFDGDGAVLAEWTQALEVGEGGYAIDSAEIRARFGLPEFTGQLFIHAIGVAGHDVIKYALDVYGTGGEPSLSVTHDANAWPSDRYAGLPAPRADERVMLWVQNSHAAPMPEGVLALDVMGREAPVPIPGELASFATRAIDVGGLLPGVSWPSQIELRTGRHVVRPRYEVARAGRTRIAHVNVERADLRPDPAIKSLSNALGRGYADGWLHGLFRYEHRRSGHAAETSFGGHIFNTLMTFKDEPQSYSGPPPGLSTRLFLKLGFAEKLSFSVLIYPSSVAHHPFSDTNLHLVSENGAPIAQAAVKIACSGSAMIFPHEIFGDAQMRQAGPCGYVLVRDTSCRLFGYHGLMDENGGFSLDHMFGF